MQLIEVEAAILIIEEIQQNKDIPKNYGTLLDIKRRIRRLSTIDAEPVVHAHWELIDNDIDTFVYRCSNCKDTIALPFGMIKEFKGCPYCLSRMDEEQ